MLLFNPCVRKKNSLYLALVQSITVFVCVVYQLLTGSASAQTAREYIESGKIKMTLLEEAKPLRQAISDFRQAVSLAPYNEEAFYYLSEAYYREGNADSASYFIAKAIELNPSLSLNYHLKAHIESKLKRDYKAAHESYTKAIQLNNADERLYAERALLYLKTGELKKAEHDISNSLRCLNKNAMAIFIHHLINFQKMFSKQDKEVALSNMLNTILLIKTEQRDYIEYLPEFYLELANSHLKMGDESKDAAIEYLRVATKLNPHLYEAYLLSAMLNLKYPSPNYKAAYEQADKVVKLQSRNLLAILLRSLANYKLQAPQTAYKDLEKLKRIYNPTWIKEQEALEMIKAIVNFAETAEYFDFAQQLTQALLQEKPEYDLIKAQIALKTNNWEQAKNLAKKVITTANKIYEKELTDKAQKLLYTIDLYNLDNQPPYIEYLWVMDKELSITQDLMRGSIIIPKTETIVVSGIVKDDSGIDKILVNNMQATYLPHNGKFQVTLALKPNTTILDLTIEVYDKKGNVTKIQKTVQIQKDALLTKDQDNIAIPTLAQKEYLGKLYVLIITASNYQHWIKLNNPPKDAHDLAQLYRELYGAEVQILENPTREKIFQILKNDYMQRRYAPQDQLLIHLAGHGYHDDKVKQGYFVPIEGEIQENDPYGQTSIHLSVLRNWIDNINCKHILVSLDFCYSGTFDDLIAMRGTETVEYKGKKGLENIKQKQQLKTRLYIASAERETVPDGKEGQNSPFTKEWLRALRETYDNQDVLTTKKLFKYLENLKPKPCMGEFSSGSNEPGSDFFFIPKPK